MKRNNQARKRKFRQLSQKGRGEWNHVVYDADATIPPGMTYAIANNLYMVMIFENQKIGDYTATLAMIQQHDAKPIPNHWRELQRIKNEIFGKDVTAIEYYPAEPNLIDDHNIYWLWMFNDGVIPIYNNNQKQKQQ